MSSDEADTKTEKMKDIEAKNDDSQSGNDSDTEPVKVNNKASKKKVPATPKIKPPAKKRVKAEQAEKEAEKDVKEEEKKKDKKKVEESEEESEEAEEYEDKKNGVKKGVPLLDQPLEIAGSRERKQVQRFTVVKKENEDIKVTVIPEGKGKELGEIPRIDHNLQRYKVESLKNLHKICFNRTGKAPVIKKNIRKFHGFDFEKDSTDYEKKRTVVSKLNVKNLKTISMILDLEKSKKKDDLVDLILNFLMKPVDSGKPVPEGRSKRKNATLKTYDEYDSDHRVNSDHKKKRVVKSQGKKKNLKEESESGSEIDEESDKKEDEEKNDVSKSENESDVEEEDEPKKKKAKKVPAKTKEKKTAAPPKKRASAKRATLAKKKKADESDDGREAEEEDNAESGGESDEGDDEPLVKKSKSPPTEDEIKAYVKSILEGANLEEITMKTVCKQVYSHYPEFDLGHKKDFIKTTVKSLISS